MKNNIKNIILTISAIAIIVSTSIYYNFNHINEEKLEDNSLFTTDNMIAVYIRGEGEEEYKTSKNVPIKGTLNTELSYCEVEGQKDVNTKITYADGYISVSNLTKKETKCYAYFDDAKEGVNVRTIIASKDIQTRTDFSKILESDTTGIIYQAADSDGTTYYFAGAPTDNWVYFAGYYWRIIRFNGDGTIRLIYNGTSTATTGEETQIGTSMFNPSYDDNMYVGFMYTSGSVHGLGISSTIKDVLDTWYISNLTDYESYIDTNAGFCGDRSISSGTGIGTSVTDYGADSRLDDSKSPSFKCAHTTDLYTVSGSSKGNKALSNPIGLITADEVAYAGGVWNTKNTSYYLYTGQNYWTITPSQFFDFWGLLVADVYGVTDSGWLSYPCVTDDKGVRPVINLRSDTAFGGSGTASDPYIPL